MHPFSFTKLPLALLALGGLAASLPAQAQNLTQNLFIAFNNGDIRQVFPKNGANLGTFVAYDATMHLYAPTYIN